MYSNLELKKLIELHKADDEVELDAFTGKILEGALNFEKKKVASCMTTWDQVYKIDINARLNFDLLLEICKTGHSRVPVVQTVLNQTRVVGLLCVKDLVLVDPEDEIYVQAVIDIFQHKVVRVKPTDLLSNVLHDFQRGLSHLAIVRDVENDNENEDPRHVIRGIITLEDIIETILQENIVDEFDQYVSMRSRKNTTRKFDADKLEFFNYRQRVRGVMSHVEATAVFHHLIKTLKVFTKDRASVSDRAFKNLLRSLQVKDIKLDKSKSDVDYVEDGGLVLYRSGHATNYFTLVLEGKVEVLAGRQKFRSEQARWSIFCDGILDSTYSSYVNRQPTIDFVPDFTCRIIKDSRLLIITREQFLACLRGKYDHIENEDEEDEENGATRIEVDVERI